MMNCNNVLCILTSIATVVTVIARIWNVNILKDSIQFFYVFLCANTVFVYYNVNLFVVSSYIPVMQFKWK